jgi:uncharacterized protein YbjQ (UPF0145 family)
MSYDPQSTEGLTEHGQERIAELRSDHLFTSDLSVNEFVLVKEAGFEPLGFVVGSCIYHIGFQQSRFNQSQEMEVLSQAMYNARELAMTRMDIGRYEWGPDMAEFIAVGTAIKHSGGVLHRAPNGRPFTSDLSGQDFWTLMKSGHRPLGMVMGSCVYHVAHQSMWKAMKNVGQNVELENFTQALYDARELAMERMQAEAKQVQAEGIVGVQLVERSHGWGAHVIEFFAVGTAVAPVSGEPPVPSPGITLTLND